MNFSLFIANKYFRSKKDSRFISVISYISIIGISLGVAALIIAISILDGFEKTISEKIVDFNSHIQISAFNGDILPSYRTIMPEIENKILNKAEIQPIAAKLCIIGNSKYKDGVTLKGFRNEDNISGLKNNMIEGEINFGDFSNPSVIIGKKLANKLMIKSGDFVTIFALKNNEIPSFENLPNIKRFKVSGIFESGMAEYDDLFAYTEISVVQNLFGLGDNITGYEIKVFNQSDIVPLTETLSDYLRYPHYVRNIYQTYRSIFTWIELQKKPIPIILGLIIIVAVFNIIGTLLMIILEKTNAIGTLRALGANKKQIILLFIIQGTYLGLTGIIGGNILAYLLLFIQAEYNIISLPSSVYFMSTVPILLKPFTFILISSSTFILCIIISIIPSYIASKILPVSTLRFG